ncbi:MFS transporter [Parvularcula sp. ZS-1/3]|uniref:MFS transporter n=1 Tax=Parvularcula mediterranea TaxID=2732508 RepID=A0A7Y3RLK6_9PROT|nr:MFS transporter [Parvularcula mediterranea]
MSSAAAQKSRGWAERFSRLAAYGVGDFGLNIYWNTLSLFLVFFYTVVVGIPPGVAGIIYSIGMAWDALSDPVIASFAERARTRHGTYRPFLLFGAPIVAAAFVLLFWVPPFDGAVLLAVLLVVGIIFRTSYTLVAIPYAALSARLTFNSQERVELTGVRMFFAFGGLLLVSGGFPFLLKAFSGGDDYQAPAFLLTALLGGIAATAALLLCFARTEEQPLIRGTKVAELSPRAFAKAFTSNSALLILLGTVFLQSLGSASLMVSLLFFLETQEGLASEGTVLTAFAVATMLGVPLWTLVIRAIGKKRCWVLAAIIMSLAGLSMLVFGTLPVMGLPVPIIVYGFAMGSFGVMLWSFVPDTVEFGQLKTGERAEAVSFGAVLISQKMAGAAMGFLVGQVLGLVGFDARLGEQGAGTSEGILIFLAVVPGAAYLISAIPVAFLPLNRQSHADMVSELERSGREGA